MGDREEGAGGEAGAKGSSVSGSAWLFMTGDAVGALFVTVRGDPEAESTRRGSRQKL